MRLSRTLSLYLLREVAQYSGLGFLVIATVLVTQNLLRRLEDLVAVGFSAGDVAAVLSRLIPMLTAYSVPIAFLFGVLVAVSRLSADSEITAMQACGVGLREIVLPVMLFGVGVSLATAWLLIAVEPGARLDLRRVLKEVASKGAILEPGRFRGIGQRVVYVQERDRENQLKQIMISDHSDPTRPFVVFAESGRFSFDSESGTIHLALERGDLHFEPASPSDSQHRRISFERLDYAFDASEALSQDLKRLRPSEMSLRELRSVLARAAAGESLEDLREPKPNVYALQFHRRLMLPLAPPLFALVGVPLGLRRARGARSFGSLICVVLVFTYYALLSLAQFLGEGGFAPPALVMWLPNGMFALAAYLLLRRARHGEL